MLGLDGYHADLHIYILWQAFDGIGFSCGEASGEVFAVYLVDMSKEADVAEQDRGLDYMAKVHIGGREDGPEVMHYLVGLIDDVGGVYRARGGVDGDLAGDIQGIARQNGLAVWAYGGGSVGSVDDLLFHGCKIQVVYLPL